MLHVKNESVNSPTRHVWTVVPQELHLYWNIQMKFLNAESWFLVGSLRVSLLIDLGCPLDLGKFSQFCWEMWKRQSLGHLWQLLIVDPSPVWKKGHIGHYTANRKDTDLEWRFLIAIRSIMFRRQWMHVQRTGYTCITDTHASRIHMHHGEAQNVFQWDSPVIRKKGAFYPDILRITTERGVSIKALHFSFWRFFRLCLMGNGVSVLSGVCCNTSKPEVIQGYRRLDSGVPFTQVGFNSRYWLHCQWLYISSFLLEFKGFWYKHWNFKMTYQERH